MKNLEDLVNSKKVINVALSSGVEQVKVKPTQMPTATEKGEDETSAQESDNAIPNVDENSENKLLKISDLTINELKGKILTSLRKDGAELVWNILQTVDFNLDGNMLVVQAKTIGDVEILQSPLNIKRIKDAFEGFEPFEIKIEQSNSSRMTDKIDEASEQVKKIFGDDIVIIK